MGKRAVRVLMIKDLDPRGCLGFDLLDVLEGMGAGVARSFRWLVTDFDPTGDETAHALASRVTAARPMGVVLSGDELLALARRTAQTIDATAVAFQDESALNASIEPFFSIGEFPESDAAHVVRAIDSSYFEVYTKDERVAEALRRRFHDVTDENPDQYFN